MSTYVGNQVAKKTQHVGHLRPAVNGKPTEIRTSLDTYDRFRECILSALKVHEEHLGGKTNHDKLATLRSHYRPRMHDSEVNTLITWLLV